ANICGSKQWILVPPGQNDLFTDVNGHWVHNLLDYDQKRFPRLHELKKFDVVQGPGETMFVPAGWWHQVRNLEDTISINHNWANEFNLQAMYERLRHDLEDVRRALSDVTAMDGFEDHVQVVLKANSGMDFDGFFAFVEYTAKRYLTGSLSAVDSYFTEPESVRRALNRIDDVLMQLGNEPTVMLISGGLLPEKISGLRVAIKNSLEIMPVALESHEYPLKAEHQQQQLRGPLKTTSEYAVVDAQTIVEALCTDTTTGLTSSAAMQRQDMYGLNILESEEEESLVVKFVKSIVTNSMVMLLLGSAGVSVLVGNWDDAFSITLAILIVSTVGFVQEYRSEKSLEALTSLVPNFSHVKRDGEWTKMVADHLVPGDVVKFATGDRIPADVRLIAANHLEVDESALTGESEPLTKTAERVMTTSVAELSFGERRNIAFMGTL
ncbi:High affinity Ca2+/Mn2+ P-type ATPase-like protein, partial [Coemansia aciculifera]